MTSPNWFDALIVQITIGFVVLLWARWFLGTTVKREYASGEGPPSKRQRLTSGASSAPSSTEKLFGSQIEDLVETIVRSTDEWPSHLLESLFSALEHTMENNGDLCATVNEYVVRYEELKRVKMRAKQEEDWSLIRWNVPCESSVVLSESVKCNTTECYSRYVEKFME